jgi:hypothetical protein
VIGGRSRIIPGTLVTPADVIESQPVLLLLWRTRVRWRRRLRQVAGNTKCGATENVVAIEDAGIRAYVPLTEFDERTLLSGQKIFRKDVEQDCCLCPRNPCCPLDNWVAGSQRFYAAPSPLFCKACPSRSRCTSYKYGQSPAQHLRRVPRAGAGIRSVRALPERDAQGPRLGGHRSSAGDRRTELQTRSQALGWSRHPWPAGGSRTRALRTPFWPLRVARTGAGDTASDPERFSQPTFRTIFATTFSTFWPGVTRERRSAQHNHMSPLLT